MAGFLFQCSTPSIGLKSREGLHNPRPAGHLRAPHRPHKHQTRRPSPDHKQHASSSPQNKQLPSISVHGGGGANSGVVNMTRALETVSLMLNNPGKTIFQVQVLVSVVAALLFLQFFLDFCKRLWPNAIICFGLTVCNKLMFPLIIYTLGVMLTSPIKNSVYPVWAVSLIMASGATGAIQQSDRPNIQKLSNYIEVARYFFYYFMFCQLLNTTTTEFSWSPVHWKINRPPSASSICIITLFACTVVSKFYEVFGRIFFGFFL